MPIYAEQPDVSGIIERVHTFVREHQLWQPGQHLLVAVSGGPDSVALLDILYRVIAPDAGLRLTVAHVNHCLRAEADEDAAFVEELANSLRLPYLAAKVDVPARVAETGESVEEAARELRYAALEAFARDAAADWIVTGHHADDQAETVLMRILRGTGLAGLAGIPPRRANIIRPLLPIWRSELLTYLKAYGLAYRADATNLSTDFARNRIRLELLPMLEDEYAPRLRHRLYHLSDMARQDHAVLQSSAVAAYERLRQPMTDGVAIPLETNLPPAIVWRVWRLAIAEVRGSLEDISFDHFETIRDLLPGQRVHLPGVHVSHEADYLLFLSAIASGEHAHNIPEEPLSVPGWVCFLDAGSCLATARYLGKPAIEQGDVAVMDAGAIRGELHVRSWRPGDRFRPLGAPGTRKIQDIFVDAGVPRRLRERIPIVLDQEGIIWLAGFRIAERVKILPTTTDSLRISIEWEFNPWTLRASDAV